MVCGFGRSSRVSDVENSETFRTDWKSIYIVALVAFIGSVHTNCVNPGKVVTVIRRSFGVVDPDVLINFWIRERCIRFEVINVLIRLDDGGKFPSKAHRCNTTYKIKLLPSPIRNSTESHFSALHDFPDPKKRLESPKITTVSGVWPYMKVLIPDVSENFYGFLSTVTGVGIISSALVAGWSSNKLRDTTLPMLCGKIFAIISCILYMLTEIVGIGSRRAFFLLFELILGFSVGSANIYRVHVAMATTEKDRPRAVGITSLAPSIGIFAGPLSQLAFTALGYPGFPLFFGMHLNLYTAPIVMIILISLIGSLLLIFCFDGRMRLQKQPEPRKVLSRHETRSSVPGDATSYDKVAFLICLYTKMLINFCVMSFNVLFAPYAMIAFQWTSEQTVMYISICMALIGLNSFFWTSAYIFFGLQKRLPERRAIVISILVFLAAYLLTYPWPFLSDTIPYQSLNDNSPSPLGCNREFAWCGTTPRVNKWVFLGSLVITLGFAYPMCQINVDILFSKVLGNGIKQGSLQSFMIVFGEGLIIFAPVLFTKVYTISGPTFIWMFEIGVLCASLILWGIFYKRMVGKTERLT